MSDEMGPQGEGSENVSVGLSARALGAFRVGRGEDARVRPDSGLSAPPQGFFDAAAAMISCPGERRNGIVMELLALAATTGGCHPEYSLKSSQLFTSTTTLIFLAWAPLRAGGVRRKRSRPDAFLTWGAAVSPTDCLCAAASSLAWSPSARAAKIPAEGCLQDV